MNLDRFKHLINFIEFKISDIPESASEYISAGSHGENCISMNNTDEDDLDGDKHYSSSTMLEDLEQSVRNHHQYPKPNRNQEEEILRHQGNSLANHQTFGRYKR